MSLTMTKFTRALYPVVLVGIAGCLAACSGGSGEKVEQSPDFSHGDGDNTIQYTGPSPSTADVQNFKSSMWDNLTSEERCGSCHVEGGTSPAFVRRDDINQAYAEANSVVDLEIPANSRVVQKVGGGHNCWASDPQVCAEILTNYISSWANASGTASNVIVLTPPPVISVADSKSFPADSALFGSTVHPVLKNYCASCHSEDSALQQQPYLGSADVDVAYDAARSKMNLDTPGSSRLVLRLANEFHNCWENCTSDANYMTQKIAEFAAGIPVTEVDPHLVVSDALGLPNGIVVSSGGRVESNVIALYEFKSSSLQIAYDTSGVDPALDLNLSGNVQRVGGWGIRINDGKAQGSTSSSAKLAKLIRATGEYSIEAWVVPDNVSQDGPARIVSYSGGSEIRNFMLGQTLYNYNFANRSSGSDGNGMPMVSTDDAAEVLQATLQHVVANYNPIEGMTLFVNGVQVASNPEMAGTNLNDWDDTFALALGNEVDNQYLWQGVIRFLAIHNRTLTPEEVVTNFDVGVGEKFYLMFGVSEHVDLPESYIVFQVEQYDSYSYLFNTPFFISLSDQSPAQAIAIEGMRIGVNGREAPVGQVYANLNMAIDSANYNAETGTTLSPLGTIVELDKGPDNDQFFLSFDRIGSHSYSRTPPAAPQPPAPADLDYEQSDIGLRHFAEINATIARMTRTPAASTPASVSEVYNTVRQQLPVTEAIDTFLAAHQAGVMQLSVAYCTALMKDSTRRATVFPGFNFAADVTRANADSLIDPLLDGLLANPVSVEGSPTVMATQADPAALKTDLYTLVDDMAAADTETTAIAICAATAGSAVMLIQ